MLDVQGIILFHVSPQEVGYGKLFHELDDSSST